MNEQPLGLFVNTIEVDRVNGPYPEQWGDIEDAPWKVSYCDGEQIRAIPLRFARKVDAEMALESIKDLIEWSGPCKKIVAQIKAYGLRRFRLAMVQNLAW